MKWRAYLNHIDSGIAWFGKIPAHWKTTRIKHLASPGYKSFIDGDWIETPYITDEGIRLIQTGNIGVGKYREQGYRYISEDTFYELNCTEVMPGDILICRLASPVGRACIAPDLGTRMITSVDVCILRPRENHESRFIAYFLSNEAYLKWMKSLSRGSTRARISRSMLGDIEFVAPSLPEQRTIAAFLDRETERIDGLIAKKERQIELLQEKRAALISHAVTKGLAGLPGATHFGSALHLEFKDSGIKWLGEIPEHWAVERSKVVFFEVKRRSETGDEELLTVSHITGVTPRSAKHVYMFMAETLEGYKRCKAGDLVINTMWAWMGALGIAFQDGVVSPSYNVYRFRHPGFDPRYYDRLFRTDECVAEINRFSQGVWKSRLRLYPEEFFQIRIPCPPKDEQLAIADFLDRETERIDSLVTKVQDSIETLREYRTALISAAVTGKIDVRDEQQVQRTSKVRCT